MFFSFCRFSIALLAIAIFFTCSIQLLAGSNNVLKIAVTQNGNVTANGKRATLAELAHACRDLAKQKGEVWYYREAPKEDPPPIALKVLEIVTRYDLPIRLSSKPDYSDSINEKGESVRVR